MHNLDTDQKAFGYNRQIVNATLLKHIFNCLLFSQNCSKNFVKPTPQKWSDDNAGTKEQFMSADCMIS